MTTAQDRGSRVQLAQLLFNLGKLGLIGEINFVEKDFIRETNLFNRFILNSFARSFERGKIMIVNSNIW